MSTVRSIRADCASNDDTTLQFDTADKTGIDGAVLVACVNGKGPSVFLTLDDLRLITEFMHREIQRADPGDPF